MDRSAQPISRIRSPSAPPPSSQSWAKVCRNWCGCTAGSYPASRGPPLQHPVQPGPGDRPPVPRPQPQPRGRRQPVPSPHPQIRHDRPGRRRGQRHDPPLGGRAGPLQRHHPHEQLRDHIHRQITSSAAGPAQSAARPRSASGSSRGPARPRSPRARPFPVTSSRSVMNCPGQRRRPGLRRGVPLQDHRCRDAGDHAHAQAS